MEIAARNCPEMSSCVQRFLISGPDLRITARFSPETHSSVQRFRISWGQFGNRCKVMPVYDLQRAAILDFGPRLENHCKIFPRNTLQRAAIPDFMGSIWESLQRRKVPPAVVVAATRSASDSILRCRKGEWFRLLQALK